MTNGIFIGEEALAEQWWATITPILEKANLKVANRESLKPVLGGRHGQHTEYLQPLLEEMTEVFRIDENAAW